MAYKAINNIFVDNETIVAGSVVELEPATAKGFLERGSIVEYDPAAEAETAEVKPAVRKGEVLETIEINDNVYKRLNDGLLTFYTLNDSEEIDEAAFTSAKQEKVKEDIQEERAADSVAVHSDETPHTDETTPDTSEEVEDKVDPLETSDQAGQQSQPDQSESEQSSTNTQQSSSTSLHLR